jgi:branched-chain amino acid transport system permease protein
MVIVLANLLRSKPGRPGLGRHPGQRHRRRGPGNQRWRYKLLAFFVAGAIAALPALSGSANRGPEPEHFPWFWSLWLVGVILIGGVGSIHGAIFGAIFMVVIMEVAANGP